MAVVEPPMYSQAPDIHLCPVFTLLLKHLGSGVFHSATFCREKLFGRETRAQPKI